MGAWTMVGSPMMAAMDRRPSARRWYLLAAEPSTLWSRVARSSLFGGSGDGGASLMGCQRILGGRADCSSGERGRESVLSWDYSAASRISAQPNGPSSEEPRITAYMGTTW